MPEITFGTDGWRGVIGDTYTYENVRVVSQAVADYIGKGKKIAFAYDTRFSSDHFARTAAEVIARNGIDVILSDRAIPTPALSFTVKNRKLDLGIMITASHNPGEYNGFKIKTASGGAAGPDVTKAVEALLGKGAVQKEDRADYRVPVDDFSSDYVSFLRGYIDFKKIRKKKFRILVDAMHGAGDSFIGRILKGSDIRVEFIRETVNPTFGGKHPEPIEGNLEQMIARMKKEKFDLGIALDGDADRIAAVAPGGVYINPQKILGLLTLHLHEDRKWTGGVVKTLCGTEMIDSITGDLGIKLYETPVGFKYISNLMETEDIVAGGEEAGGMGVKNYIPERDGSLAGLLLLEMMVYRNRDILRILQEVEKKYGRYYYVREDLKLAKKVVITRDDLPKELLGVPVTAVKDYDGVKMLCQDRSWLMLRVSGTEPLVRLYAESKSLKKTRQLLARGRELVQEALKR